MVPGREQNGAATDVNPDREARLVELVCDWIDASTASDETVCGIDNTADSDTDALLADFIQRAVNCFELLDRVWGEPDTSEPISDEKSFSVEMLPALRVESPQQFGRFVIRRELGRGGFGIVFLAHDPDIGRDVALKIPHAVFLLDSQMRERFQREARAAGRLNHPNLVAIYETGKVGEIYYQATAYCSGPTLWQWLHDRTKPVPHAVAAGILAVLADAVQHAHQRGIVHRDIKPNNVLLEPTGRAAGSGNTPIPGFPFMPKLTDFGLARDVYRVSDLTQTGQLMGTAEFMAPEQAAARHDDIGPPTDVYALGAVLYTLIAGQAPISGGELYKTLERVQTEVPLSLTRRRPQVPRDLEAICFKCLEKKPAHRYATAAQLSLDLQRFLSGEPVSARMVPPAERLIRWCKRNPAATAVFGLVLILAASVWTGMFLHNEQLQAVVSELDATNTDLDRSLRASREARLQAEAAVLDTRQQLYANDIARAYSAWESGDLAAYDRILRRWLREGQETDLRGIEWHYLWSLGHIDQQVICQFDGAGSCLARSLDNQLLAVGGGKGIVRVMGRSLTDGVARIDTGQGIVRSMRLSHDGRRLATAGFDGTVRVWDLMPVRAHGRTQNRREKNITEPLFSFGASIGALNDIVFSIDDQQLITCGNSPEIHIWDAATGHLVSSLGGHEDTVKSIAVSPDGEHLYSGGTDRFACVWKRTESGFVEAAHHYLPATARRVAVTPDGQTLAFVSANRLYMARPPEREKSLIVSLNDELVSLRFSPDGTRLATCGVGGMIHVYDVASGVPEDGSTNATILCGWLTSHDRIHDIEFTPDGCGIVAIGDDGLVSCCPLPERRLESVTLETFRRPLYPVLGAASKDVYVNSQDHVYCWHAKGGEQQMVVPHETPTRSVAVSPGERKLALSTADGSVEYWDLQEESAKPVWKTRPWHDESDSDTDDTITLWFSPDGKRLAMQRQATRPTVILMDVATRDVAATYSSSVEERAPESSGLAYTATGNQIALGVENSVVIWRPDDGTNQLLDGHIGKVLCVCFHPSGSLLASGSRDRTIRLWNVASRDTLAVLEGHRDDVWDLVFSADGKTLFSCSHDGTVKAWQVSTGRELFNLVELSTPIENLTRSADGKCLSWCDHKRTLCRFYLQ